MTMTNWRAATGPSRNLSWDELACHDALRTCYPIDWRETRAVVLAAVFEAIRSACGDVPITIKSAYRTPAHNKAVGGAPKSQHMEGRALDLATPAGFTNIELHRRIHQVALNVADLKGIGLYDWGCHIDIRPSDSIVGWDLRSAQRAITV